MKNLLAALTLLVVALVAWLALGGRREHGNGLRPVEPAVQVPSPSSDGPSDDVEDPAPIPPGPESRRIASVEDLPAADAVASLIVVQAADGRPVRGADVAFVDLEDLLPEEVAELVPEHPLSDRALRTRTDDQGRVRIPRPRGIAWATASIGDRSGFATIPAAAIEARLELHTDKWIAVRVVRHDGSPATGVPVELRRFRHEVFGEDGLPALTRAFTDLGGLARLRCFQDRDPSFPHLQFEDPAMAPRLSVVADVCAVPAVALEWSEESAIELRLPPMGALEVRVVAPGGRRLEEDTKVFLSFHAPSERSSGTSGVRTTSGVAVFPHVQADLTLSVTAIPLEGVRPAVASLAGPSSEGQRVTLDLEVEGAFAFLAGRLVDADGEPLTNTRFEYEAIPGTSGVRRTDEHGRFAIGATEETAVLAIFTVVVAGEELETDVELDTLRPGTRDLGDVRLLPKRD